MGVFEMVTLPAVATDAAAILRSDLTADGDSFVAEVPKWLSDTGSWLIGIPLRIVLIVVVSLLLLAVVHRAIKVVTERVLRGKSHKPVLARTEIGAALLDTATLESPRREQRIRTLGSVLRSTSNILVTGIAVLLVLDELGINIAPLVASAGIVGVALGFGAQSLVKDFLSGVFLLMEDQYGVGDLVQIGDVTGTVESVALRVTRLRDVDGVLWIIRNGEILNVGNKTQGWARASVAIRVPYDANLPIVYEALQQAADDVMEDESLSGAFQSPPTVGGIENMTSQSLTIRVAARTDPAKVWPVTVALRERIREIIDERKIPLAPDVPPGLLA